MLFMTVSSVMTRARLERVQRVLRTLSEGLERVRHLMEAGDYARFEGAAGQLDEIGSQFEHGQRFTEGMKIRLMLAKRDVNRLRRKFGHLAIADHAGERVHRIALDDGRILATWGKPGRWPGQFDCCTWHGREHREGGVRGRHLPPARAEGRPGVTSKFQRGQHG